MAGRRYYQAERRAHAAIEHRLMQEHHRLLKEKFPALEFALCGQQAILRYFAALGVVRRNNNPLTWQIVNRWRSKHGCPIARGNRHPRFAGPAVSTNLALSAWVLSRFSTADLFHMDANAQGFSPRVAAPRFPARQSDLIWPRLCRIRI